MINGNMGVAEFYLITVFNPTRDFGVVLGNREIDNDNKGYRSKIVAPQGMISEEIQENYLNGQHSTATVELKPLDVDPALFAGEYWKNQELTDILANDEVVRVTELIKNGNYPVHNAGVSPRLQARFQNRISDFYLDLSQKTGRFIYNALDSEHSRLFKIKGVGSE